MPLPISLLLFIIGLLYLFSNSYRKAKIFLSLAFLWIILLSFQPISNAIIQPLENSHPSLLKPPLVSHILVLGSGHKVDESLSITSQVKSTAINRLNEGIKLYKQIPNSKLIVSGYGGKEDKSHALMQEKLALALGVKKEDIIRFDKPKDTKQEAMETKKLLFNKKFILVTSASHMKRSILLFKKEGLNPIAAPTNHLGYSSSNYKAYFSSFNLYKTRVAFHEYLGLAWGYIRGII